MSYKHLLKYNYKPVKGLKISSRRGSKSSRGMGSLLRKLMGRTQPYELVYDPHLEFAPKNRWRGRFVTSTAVVLGLPLLWAFQSNAFYGPLNVELKSSSLLEILERINDEPMLEESRPDGVLRALSRGLQQTEETPTSVSQLMLHSSAIPQAVANTLASPSITNKNKSSKDTASSSSKNNSKNPEESAWLSITVKSGDNLSSIFSDNGLSKSELHRILDSGKSAQHLKWLRPGQAIRIKRSEDGSIDALLKEIDFTQELYITRSEEDGADIFTSKIQEREVENKTQMLQGVIKNSLFSSAREAGLSDRLVLDLVRIFGWDIDFALDIQPGDSFNVLYEEFYHQGKKVKTGNILAARFTNEGRVYEAVRYTDKTGYSAYFTPDGHSMQKAFLRTPVKLGFISSGFNLQRRHPILNTIRAHKGVDYAAPTGTPVYATGSGKIITKGRKGGYGNTIVIQHGEQYKTLYGHLSKYSKKLNKGDRVRQGQLIGYVGKTGLATGAHLHYEFLENDVHKNPLRVKAYKSLPIDAEYQKDFLAQTNSLVAQLDSATTMALVTHTNKTQ